MRIRTILAAAAAPAALAAVLLGTTSAPAAHAATVGSVAITNQGQADSLQGATIGSNVDVPAGADVHLGFAHITGNLTVEGKLGMFGDTVDGNVTVSGINPATGLPGGAAGIDMFNGQATIIKGNLTINGTDGFASGNVNGQALRVTGVGAKVGKNFTFTNNTGWLDTQGGLQVAGNFTASGNGPWEHPEWAWQIGGLTARNI